MSSAARQLVPTCSPHLTRDPVWTNSALFWHASQYLGHSFRRQVKHVAKLQQLRVFMPLDSRGWHSELACLQVVPQSAQPTSPVLRRRRWPGFRP